MNVVVKMLWVILSSTHSRIRVHCSIETSNGPTAIVSRRCQMASWIRVNEHDSGELLGYANDDVGIHQDAKDSAADGAGTVAETAAATAVVVGSGGTATALGGGFGALGSLTGAVFFLERALISPVK
jgi:hypothetical protein